jgi:hypothetical protein
MASDDDDHDDGVAKCIIPIKSSLTIFPSDCGINGSVLDGASFHHLP